MDDLDKDLVGLLRINAREPVSSLARKLNSSRSTIQDRISRLERNGVIEGYALRLRANENGYGIRAYVTISVEPQRTALIVEELKSISALNTVHTLSGKFDILVQVTTDTTEEMDKVLDKLGEIPGVLKTESSIVLSTKLDRK